MRNHSDKLLHAQGLLQSGQLDQARVFLLRTLQRGGNGPAANQLSRLLSQVLLQTGQHDQALYYAERSVAGPGDADGLVHLANILWSLGRAPHALETARRAVAAGPSSRNSHATLVNFLLREEKFADALAAAETALSRFPGDAEFVAIRATMLVSVGRPEAAVAELRAALARDSGNLRLLGALGPALNYAPDVEPRDVLAVHRAYADALHAAIPRTTRRPARPSPDPDRPLRVGFVSPDLRNHAMQYFIEPVLAYLDRAAFTSVCYFVAAHEDDASRRLKAHAGDWKHVPALHAGQLAELIEKDRIDILIDLAGHTRYHRLATMALKPAPILASYIGYPQTTGLPQMDFIICDSRCVPNHPQEAWVERPLLIDPVYFCYMPPADAPEVAPPPRAAVGHVTFGSFNTLMKLNDRVVETWARVVKDVPGSRLLLKNVQLMQEEARIITRERFVAAGVPDDRLEILGHTGTMADHLATYARIDIALDTFPYAGMTTTCESLLMGVPVVTLAQRTMASRVGRSILAATGLEALVAHHEEDFVRIATALAADTSRLTSMRTSLRKALLDSPVCDAAAYGRRFAAALRSAWHGWCGRARGQGV